MDIVLNNPYRILGIYSNSSTKEKLANRNKLGAFLKIGKQVKMSLDLPCLLGNLERTSEMVEEAESKLTLPADQLKYAQFWFVKSTTFDEISFNHLLSGNIEKAVSIWSKKDSASSLQNQFVCALLVNDYSKAISCVEKLYPTYLDEFVSIVLGNIATIDYSKIEYDLLDVLIEEIGANNILSYITNDKWRSYVKVKETGPLIYRISEAVNKAKSSRGKSSLLRLLAGNTLIKETKDSIIQLKSLLSPDDLRYKMIADKLGLEILQCGIDYYNGSNSPKSAFTAMKIQKYALSVVVGQLAKERCEENVGILQKIIDRLPPREVFEEVIAIEKELSKYCKLPDTIQNARLLLGLTKPNILKIKNKLGANNPYYLKISTKIVGNALYNVIEVVNSCNVENGNYSDYLKLKDALRDAWNVTQLMDTFDIEASFKTERYDENRSILKKLCEDFGVIEHLTTRIQSSQNTSRTNQSSQTESKTTTNRPVKNTNRTSQPTHITTNKPIKKTESVKSNNGIDTSGYGCIVSIIIISIIIAGMFIGNIHENNDASNESVDDTVIADSVEMYEDNSLSTGDRPYESQINENYSSDVQEDNNEYEDVEKYINNRLATGSKPYPYLGKSHTGNNYMSFRTSGNHDFVVIVKRASDDKYMNHVYVRGGDNTKLYLPDGTFDVYFYSGRGWNPNKIVGNYRGGFVSSEAMQKDEYVELISGACEYTLYPVKDGNLTLESVDKDEVFK